MEPPRRLTERPLLDVLHEAAAKRVDGAVVLREQSGIRHGVWLRAGYVVGAHAAGRRDPILSLLVARGALDSGMRRRCLEALPHAGLRAGKLASALAGVPAPLVREALQQQLADRLAALLQIAASDGYDAGFEPGPVPDGEVSVCMPLGALLRRTPSTRPPSRDEARRTLRRLARLLHPDCHGHLDPAAQRALSRQLAEATAAYHGFH